MGVITKKITESELQAIRDIKQEYANLALAFGELELQKFELVETQKALREKESKLALQLQEKYGNGNIDISTGEITQ
jgi:septal ring factor EnvC (AmiA/AmiB activator)